MSWGDGFMGKGSGRKKPGPPPQKTDRDGVPVVFWLPPMCAWCGARKSRIDHTAGLVRFHTCDDCGGRFKSIEDLSLAARPSGDGPQEPV